MQKDGFGTRSRQQYVAAVRKEVSQSWKVVTVGLFARGVGLFSPTPAVSADPFPGAMVAKPFPFPVLRFKYELSSFTSLIFFAPKGSRNTFFFLLEVAQPCTWPW